MEVAIKFNFLLLIGMFLIFIEFVDCEEPWRETERSYTNYSYRSSGFGLFTIILLIISLVRCCAECGKESERPAEVTSGDGEWISG
jgi:hypothetical protein